MAIKHTFVSAKADGADTSLVRPSDWNADHTIEDASIAYAKIQNVSATDKILGRSTAGAGVVEEITCTAAGRALIDDADAAAQRTTLGLGSLATQSGTFSGTSSGTNTGDQTITLTGDVTGTGTGSFATTIGASKVTNAMLAGSIALTKLAGDTTTAVGVGTVELGHASDTTLSRSSAGVLAIEGVVVPTISSTNTLTNKSLSDSTTFFIDETDTTKKLQFQLSGITTATTRTLTVPNVDGTIVTTGDTGSVTNTMLAGSVALTKLTSDTTTALGLGTLELGHASDTTLSRSSAGVLAVEGVVVPTISSSNSLSNKTIALGSNTVSGTKAQFNTACTDDDFPFLGAANTFTSTNVFTTIGLDSTAATSTSSIITSKNVSGTAYGLNLTYNQTGNGDFYPITVTGRAKTTGANGNMWGASFDLNNQNGANLTSLTGLSVIAGSTATSTVTTLTGMVMSSTAQSTTTTHRGCEIALASGSSSSITNSYIYRGTWTGGGSGGTTTTLYGLRLDGWTKNSGTVTTSYGIYMDTTVGPGTTAYGIYSTLDKPSYFVGKMGIGSGVTAPTARLQVRDTTEQVRVEYDGNNYLSTTLGSNAETTYQLNTNSATLPRFIFKLGANNGAEVGTWRYDASYAFFGNSALDHTNIANFALVQNTSGIVFINAPSGQYVTIRSNGTQDMMTIDNTSISLKNYSTGFFGVTPVARPTTGVAAATFTANSGTAVNDASTFDGYTIKQVVKALRNLGLLT